MTGSTAYLEQYCETCHAETDHLIERVRSEDLAALARLSTDAATTL